MLMGDLAQVAQALQHGRIVRDQCVVRVVGNAPYHKARAVGAEQPNLAIDGLVALVDKSSDTANRPAIWRDPLWNAGDHA